VQTRLDNVILDFAEPEHDAAFLSIELVQTKSAVHNDDSQDQQSKYTRVECQSSTTATAATTEYSGQL
jgi:hypothetical protein